MSSTRTRNFGDFGRVHGFSPHTPCKLDRAMEGDMVETLQAYRLRSHNATVGNKQNVETSWIYA